jgi:hypothetical protein
LILKATKDSDSHVQRAAIELLMDYPEMSTVEATLSVLNGVPEHDTHLIYTSRLCLRNVLRHGPLMKEVVLREWNVEDKSRIAGTLVDVASPDAAIFLAKYLEENPMPENKTLLAYQQLIRFIPSAQLESVIKRASEKKNEDLALNTQVFRGIKEGLAQRGGPAHEPIMRPWGAEIAEGLLKKYPADSTLCHSGGGRL